ncbi:DinB family protein [Saxibacter everestensis]|uniref:DinB family protein n=1 Tax=Saxibacter everestensis TaxID=2909229 RepID=A0ABY8QYT4_9MICO|nr:DinB family protein [Brevibacteriaceae bacterium ZFBP1038]
MTTTANIDLGKLLIDQLQWHWDNQLRPRLDGLSDAEYFWRPVPNSWSVHRRGESTAPVQAGSGDFTIDFAFPEPTPAPVTTIAWRLGHLLVGVYGARLATHFGGAPADYMSYDYPGTATEALSRLDEMHSAWIAGVASLDANGLQRPCGEEGFEQEPMAALLQHINREVIHHGAEIALLRDLWANQA